MRRQRTTGGASQTTSLRFRSKGLCWLASRPDMVGNWSQAGAVARHGLAGIWWVDIDSADWPFDPELLATIRDRWQEPYGDRQQELVLIGINMDEDMLRGRLDACLLTDKELVSGPRGWRSLPGPFPQWVFLGEEEDVSA